MKLSYRAIEKHSLSQISKFYWIKSDVDVMNMKKVDTSDELLKYHWSDIKNQVWLMCQG